MKERTNLFDNLIYYLFGNLIYYFDDTHRKQAKTSAIVLDMSTLHKYEKAIIATYMS